MSKKTFHKIQSFLSLRKPSNKDDEKFISEIESPYQAAKLRSASKDKSVDSFHSPVNFSWSAFWKSLIYENLPPVIFSPLAAIFLEGSLSRAWHVSQNRGLIAVSTKHHPIDFIIQSNGIRTTLYDGLNWGITWIKSSLKTFFMSPT